MPKSPRSKVTTVIWDFDGTLADTMSRNLAITRRIVERLFDSEADSFPVLEDRDTYSRAVHAAENWRELYTRQFGLPAERTDEAAALWIEFHEEDSDVPGLFEGVEKVVHELGDRRQGIVSQNGHDNIRRALAPAGLFDRFAAIVADEDLPFHRQKPEPDGLLQCAERLHSEASHGPMATVLYVGDHPVDIECVRRAAVEIERHQQPWRMLSVGVEYGGGARQWQVAPDFRASTPEDVLTFVAQLDG